MDRFNVRLPSGMRDAIAERAKANGRSMNSEIVQILEDALEPKPEEANQKTLYVDLFAGLPSEDDRIVVSKGELLMKIDEALQNAIAAAADVVAKSTAESTVKSLAEKFDFVPKSKKPT